MISAPVRSEPRVPSAPLATPQASQAPQAPSAPRQAPAAAAITSSRFQDSFQPAVQQKPPVELQFRPASVNPTLSQGSKGPEVAELQTKLHAKGFDSGPVDGDFGPMTDRAVRDFQGANGLEVDGIAGPNTWAKLNEPAAPLPPAPPPAVDPAGPVTPAPASGARPTLQHGSKGPDVVDLQNRLNAAGFDAGAADGDFGPRTDAAVRSYQASRGLEVDGVAGPQTWKALLEGAAPIQQPPPVSGDLRQRIVDIAQREVGTLEDGANGGDVLKYANSFGRGAEEWCGDFVSWVNTQAGNPMNSAYVPSLHTQLQAEGKWKGQNNPQPGDIVIFDWEGKGEAWHVGLVKSVNADGTIQTIEGNTSQPGGGPQGVWEKTRDYSTILGFANP